MTERDWAADSDDDLDDFGSDDDSGETEVVLCPMCGASVYEDVEQCPACGEWITTSTHPFAGRAVWFVALGVLGIVATIVVLVIAGF